MRFQNLLVSAAGALGLSCGNASALPEFSTTLAVDSRAGQVLVHVTIHNSGSTTAYIPRALAGDPQPLGKTFTLTAGPGAIPVDYTGRMVKRGPIGPDDFIAVKPRATLRHTLDISNSYAFLPGAHQYTLHYAGATLTDVRDLARTGPLLEASAQFTHTGE